jgi:hypothetical protein
MSQELSNWFSSCSDKEKIVFLAWLSHQLTIHGRSFGVGSEVREANRAFKGLNELQHTISQNIAHLAAGTNARTGEFVLEALDSKANHYGLAAHLRQSLQWLAARRGLEDA